MALLDVSEVLFDPDFADSFPVKRRSEVVGSNGRAASNEVTLPAVGVITAATPNDLERLPEDQRTLRSISVITNFRLRATAPDYKPDLIGWKGDFYVVADIQDYSHYGAGFVQAICTSISYQDQPPPEQVNASVITSAEDEGSVDV